VKFCLATNHDNGKGLQVDVSTLSAALKALGHSVVFAHTNKDATAPSADVIVFLEDVRERFFSAAPIRWWIPNAEWPQDAALVARVDLVLCKTRDAFAHFARRGLPVYFLGFAGQDVGVGSSQREGFLHVAGGSTMKGTAKVIAAWARAGLDSKLTVVSSVTPEIRARNVVHHRRLDLDVLRALQRSSSIHVQPSDYEGFGHVLREAASCGAILITTDAAPMNEIEPSFACEAEPMTTRDGVNVVSANARDLAEKMRDAFALSQTEGAARERERMRATWERERADFMEHLDRAVAALPDAPVRLSICMPCHASALPFVQRSVMALRAQIDRRFEVVLCVDGGERLDAFVELLTEAARRDLPGEPVRVTVVESKRPRGADLPHRNHARNGAWKNSTGDVCFILDADFILPPHAVGHVLAIYDQHASTRPVVLTPCMGNLPGRPNDWLSSSASILRGLDAAGFEGLKLAPDSSAHSGFLSRASKGGPSFAPIDNLPEGMPILSRALLEALDGFDEDTFGEWGGDKEELTDRVKGAQRVGLLDVVLIRSLVALHQPHVRDPAINSDRTRDLQRERERRWALIESNAAWWRVRLARIADTFPKASVVAKKTTRALEAASADFPSGHIAGLMFAKCSRPNAVVECYGTGADEIANVLKARGMDARACDASSLPGDRPAAVVTVNLFDSKTDEDVGAWCSAMRARAHGAAFVMVEKTSLAAASKRAPIMIQRSLKGASVSGSVMVDGVRSTVFLGRLVE
jgi:hypothetical protein